MVHDSTKTQLLCTVKAVINAVAWQFDAIFDAIFDAFFDAIFDALAMQVRISPVGWKQLQLAVAFRHHFTH